MRIGVISDTHADEQHYELPKKVLEDFKRTDMIIHAGDITNAKILLKLRSLSPNLKAVYGNMDSQEISRGLAAKEIFNVGKFKIGLTHGSGSPAQLIGYLENEFKKDKLDMIIFGHSHQAFNKIINGVIFFNPGSATDKIFAKRNTYGIIEINDTIKAEIVEI
jgi:uncharacterized protein